MSAVRDSNVVKYLHLQSAKDRTSGEDNNFSVAVGGGSNLQGVRACQLLNASFSPILENVPDGENYLDVDQTHTWIGAQFYDFGFLTFTFADASIFPGTYQWSVPVETMNVGKKVMTWANFSGGSLTDIVNTNLSVRSYPGAVAFITAGPDMLPYLAWRVLFNNSCGPAASLTISNHVSQTPTQAANWRLMMGLGVGQTSFTWTNNAASVTGDASTGNPLLEPEIVRTRYTVPAGIYTYEELATALTASSIDRVPLNGPGDDYHTSKIDCTIDGDNIFTIAALPKRAQDEFPWPPTSYPDYALFTVVLDSPIAAKLGFVQNTSPTPGFSLWSSQANNGEPNLGTPNRCFIHVRPANNAGGLVVANDELRSIAAWGVVDLTHVQEGTSVFQDFGGGGDSTYFVGFLDNRDFTIMDFSVRYNDGRLVRLRNPGLEVTLKLFVG